MTNKENKPDNTKPLAESPVTPNVQRSAANNIDKNKSSNSKQIDADRRKEHGGYGGLDPTRYGDWEHNGRCTDF